MHCRPRAVRGQAYPELVAAGAGQIMSTDTIPHKSNAINISGLLAEGIKKVRVEGRGGTADRQFFKPRKEGVICVTRSE
jgi:hypothetical protein